MTRRDTIIIAVLINVGLLIVLFTTSLGPNSEPTYASATAKMEVVAPVKVSTPPPAVVKDPIDQMIAKEEPKAIPQPLTVEKNIPTLPAEEKKIEAKNLIPVIIKQGDVLEKIAKNYHTTVEEVMKINRLPNSFLKIGQVLYIPSNSGEKQIAPMVAAATPSSKEPVYYVVKNGDNPWTIAVKNHIKVDELLKLNQLDEATAKKLKPGDRLRIQ